MSHRLRNIHSAAFEETVHPRDGTPWRHLDLSGEHLGVRVEELPRGGTSSVHHYHSSEEEHVLVLDGTATLHLGDERVTLSRGDHIWFPAGEAVPHHVENTSDAPFRFLVFGERRRDDVVFYPDAGTLVVKSERGLERLGYEPQGGDAS